MEISPKTEIVFNDFLVTCKTKGCENLNITIPVKIAEGGNVYCGACSKEIKTIEPSPYV